MLSEEEKKMLQTIEGLIIDKIAAPYSEQALKEFKAFIDRLVAENEAYEIATRKFLSPTAYRRLCVMRGDILYEKKS